MDFLSRFIGQFSAVCKLRFGKFHLASGKKGACAATHGAINGVACICLFLTAGANPLIGGLVGLVGSACFGIVGAVLWLIIVPRAHRR
jgi:hypothetical protein